MARPITERGLSKHVGEGVIVISNGVNFTGLLYADEDDTPLVSSRTKERTGESHYYLRDKDKIWVGDILYEFKEAK